MDNEILKIIRLLNGAGLSILIIDGENEIYVVYSFHPADNKSQFKHDLVGLPIMELIKSKLNSNSQGLDKRILSELITIIDSSKSVKIDFSMSYKWKVYWAS